MTNQSEQLRQVDDLRRTAAVAADYHQLQGLITATTGAGLIVWSFGNLTWAAITIAIGVALWTTYYERRYGKAAGRGSLLGSIVAVFAALIVCMVGYVADGLLHWPVLVLPLIGAACLIVSFRLSYRHVGVTWAHWAAVGFLVLSSLAPAFGLAAPGAGTGIFVLGAAMVVIGLVDHARLVAAMKPVPRD